VAHISNSEPENPLTTGQWNYKRGYAVGADELSRRLLDRPLQDGSPAAGEIDVFNTNSWSRTQVVTVSKELTAAGDCVRDANGELVTSQRLASGELAFLAVDVPAMSYRRYFVSANDPLTAGDATATLHSVENAILAARLEPSTGNVRELVLKSDGHDFVADNSTGLNEYLYVEGNKFDQPGKASLSPGISVRDRGPLVASLLVESAAPGCKKLTREIRLAAGADYVELVDLVDKERALIKPASAGGNPQDPNNGKEAIHFAFPFDVPDGEIRMDIPWAVVRPEKDQLPGSCKNWFTVQRWVDVSNAERGVTWSTIDAPLVQVGGITATLIGSQTDASVWQKHVGPSQALYSWAMNNYWHTNYRAYQEGPTIFRYAIRPHAKYSAADAQRFGFERSQPLIVAAATERAQFQAPRLKLNTPDVVVTAFKPADDGNGYVVRLFASGGKDVDLQFAWTGLEPKAVYRSNSLESKGEKVGTAIHIPAWSVVTLRAE
jgi:alpha-mannosidase